MEELTKKDILTILGENLTDNRHSGYQGFDEEEVDEMARTKYKVDKKTGQMIVDPKWPKKGIPTDEPSKAGAKFQRFRPMYSPPYETEDEKEPREHVGWYYFKDEESEPIPLVFTCEWDELTEREPKLVPMLQEKYGSVMLVNDNCPTDEPRGKGSYKAGPIPGEEGDEMDIEKSFITPGRDKETGEVTTLPTRTKILNTLNSTLNEFSSDEDVVNTLKKLSLPPIITDNRQNVTDDARVYPHVNRYSDINNETIDFESHSIQTYPSQEVFLRHTTTSLRKPADQIEKVPTFGIRRRVTHRTRNWDPLIFTSSTSLGKTPVLNLNTYDFPEDDFEVMVMSQIKISGKAIQKNQNDEVERWEWTLKYDVDYAKKLPGERQASKLKNDAQIVKRVVVDLENPQKFDGHTIMTGTDDASTPVKIDRERSDFGSNHPLTDEKIKGGLVELLDQFKNELKSTNPNMSVQRALATFRDEGAMAFQERPSLNENEIKGLIHKFMKD